MSQRLRLLVPAIALLWALSARADTTYFAVATNDQENPPTVPTLQNGMPRPASFGTAVFNLNDAQTAMTMEAVIFNIDVTGSQTPDTNDNLTAAHIHAGANFPPLNNGVVWGFFGTPFNDNNPNDSMVIPFTTGVGGTFIGKWDAPEGQNTTLAAQLDNINAGRAYINFHTVQFGGGEIRGAILIPEPSTAALLGLACVATAALRRRRH